MKRRISLLTLLSITLAGNAVADVEKSCCRAGGTPNWYAGISGGAVFLKDVDYSHSIPYPFTDMQTYRTGFGFGGEVGYRIYPNIRGELEVSTRTSDIKSDPGATLLGSGGERTMRDTAFMANAYYDWHNSSSFTPYFGAGLGEADVTGNRVYTITSTPATYTKDVSGWTTAHQFMLGIEYEIPTDFHPFEVSLGYRYFSTGTVKDKATASAPGVGIVSMSNTSNNLELGGKMFF